jgi:hypothetical protein
MKIIPVLDNLHIALLTGLTELDRAFSCGAKPRQIGSRPYGPEGNDKLFYQAVGHKDIKGWAMPRQIGSGPCGPEGNDKLFYQAVGHKDIKGWAKPVPNSSQTIRKPREGWNHCVPQPLPLSSSGWFQARQDISVPMKGCYL